MTLDELIEELTRLRETCGGCIPIRVGSPDGDTYALDGVRISSDSNRSIDLMP